MKKNLVQIVSGLALLLPVAVSAAEPHPDMPSPEVRPAPSIQALAITKTSVYAGSFGMGVFRSDNQGKDWATASEGLGDRFILSLVETKPGILYVGTLHGGVFRSTDGGRHWQAANEGLLRRQIKVLFVEGQDLYAGTGGGVYRLSAGAPQWVEVTKGLGETVVHTLVMDERRTLFAGTAAKGVQRFKADGSQWTRMPSHGLKDHEGMTENFIRVLAVGKDRTLYAGTFDGGVFLSRDGGDTWRPISRALPNDSIRGIISGDAGLLVATGRGIYKSVNDGGQWMPLNVGLTELSVQVLVAGGSTLYAGTSAGAFRSDDGGQHWVNISQGLSE